MSVKQIPLTQCKIALVDEKDYERVSQFKWYAHKSNNTTFYAVRNSSTSGGKKRARIYMHRFILGLTRSNILADHKDRDGLNNQRKNLRITDKKGNAGNTVMKPKKYSSFKGVCFRNDTNKWIAHIHINMIQKNLGNFVSEKEAALAYNRAARQHFGKFALLNEIPND